MKNFCRIAVIFLIFTLEPALSAQTGDSVTYTFTGHLIQTVTPCTVNENEVINVPFGNVSVRKVTLGGYEQDINYRLDCGSSVDTFNKVSIKVTATTGSPDWDNKALQSPEVPELGVEILKDGVAMELNKTISIDDPSHPPTLKAKLVTKEGAELSAQTFTAGGTLVAEYR